MFVARTLFTFLGMLALGAAVNPDNICVLVKDGTKIVNDVDCAAFYTCQGGKATPGTCSNGYYYSKDGQNCLPKAQVSCLGAEENVCAGISDGTFVSMAGSCSGYYHCNKGVATPGYCPNKLNFNQAGQRCDYTSDYGCSATGGGSVSDDPNLLCRYLPSDLYFGSAASCKSWQVCSNNIANAGTCGDYVFNVQTASCDYEDNYDCQQLNGDTSDTGGSASQKCTVDGSVATDPDSCSGYRVCVSGTYAKYSCKTGLFYDPTLNKCVSRQDALNNCDRCEGTTSQFVNKYQDGCTGYAICSGGKTVQYGKCPDKHYYNEIYGSCVKDEKPKFEVCQENDTPLGDCADCSDTSVINSCNVPSCEDDGTCQCACVDPCPLDVCDDCADTGVINACNEPTCEDDGTCECVCADACPGALSDCDDCADTGVINACNEPTCEDDGTCECVCADACPGALNDCDDCADTGVINACNEPTCEDDGTCECVCADPC